MKSAKKFFRIRRSPNGNVFWIIIPIERLGGSKIRIRVDKYNISDDIQNIFTDTTEKPITKQNDRDRVTYRNILASIN